MRNEKRNPAVQGGVSCNPSQSGSRGSNNKDHQKPQVTRDEIHIFLPGIDDTEYQLRAKLRTTRNCATWLITNTDSETARALAWLCADYATALIYAAADNALLEEVNNFCRRLMAVAMQAEAIDSAMESGVV